MTTGTLQLIRNGRLIEIPTERAATGGPDRGEIMLWVGDRANHHTQRFQTPAGPIDVYLQNIAPADAGTKLWDLTGEVTNYHYDPNNPLFAMVRFNLTPGKGKGVIYFYDHYPLG